MSFSTNQLITLGESSRALVFWVSMLVDLLLEIPTVIEYIFLVLVLGYRYDSFFAK